MAGTLIGTPTGLRPIETLAVGDQVSMQDGSSVRLAWVGHKSVVPRFHPNQQLFPVCIRRGALGPGTPSRDLLVSANHRVVCQGPDVELVLGYDKALVSAKFLVGLPRVFVDKAVSEVTYVHLLFDQHKIIWAEGLACENLHPGDLAMEACGRDAAEEIYDLFPALRNSVYRGYGPLAMPSLTKRESLVLRDMRASKPPLQVQPGDRRHPVLA